jgi:catechol 2,3-dioxygenase-like lactoylglutathione lyase family enzyme
VKPAGIHHVAICVPDAAAALTFYRDVLGMTERTDRPDFGFPGHWLDAGGQQLHLMEMNAAPAPSNHFAIRVDDLGAAVEDLRARGVEVHPVDHVPGAGRQAFLNDPFGNTIELNQPDQV